ncbi:MAG: dihydropteroate synthase [Acidimicrobiia bacterium]
MDDTSVWRVADLSLPLCDPLVMGILNVTPDSFSDGGDYVNINNAVEHARAMVSDGAAIVDIGGESTRPGAEPIDVRTEHDRVMPVVAALASEGIVVSVDTSKPAIAEEALAAGAKIVNDVTGLTNPDMRSVCADSGAGVVVMHMQGTPETMQIDPTYDDVVVEIGKYLARRSLDAIEAGIRVESVAIDPGIGFGKTLDHNLTLLRELGAFTHLGYPVVVGTSRKGFLGSLLEPVRGHTEPSERDGATAATMAAAVLKGAKILRVHNVRLAVDVAVSAKAMVPEEHDAEKINRT